MKKKFSYLFGIQTVSHAIKFNPNRVLCVYVSSHRSDKRLEKLLLTVKKKSIKLVFVPKEKLDKLVNNAAHQGVLAECAPIKSLGEDYLVDICAKKKNLFFLILDGVQDPHNLGACLRSADAAGVDAVIAPKKRSVSLTDVVCKVASGAAETVPFIQVTNLSRVIKLLQKNNIWIYGATADADTALFDVNLTGSVAIVLGAEGQGLRQLTAETCDGLLKIPLCGSVDSLNVSVASGIFLFEVVRQRNINIDKLIS